MNKCGVVLTQCKVNAFANVFKIKFNSQINKKGSTKKHRPQAAILPLYSQNVWS